MNIDTQKLEKFQKKLKTTINWIKKNKVLALTSAGVFLFLCTVTKSCITNNRLKEEAFERAQLIQEEQKRVQEEQKRVQEEQKRVQEKEKKRRRLFSLVENKRYQDEDNLENRKALKEIRELIDILGVDIKGDNQESLLYCAYKEKLPEKFISLLKELGVQMSEDEIFEVQRVAKENFLQRPNDVARVERCVDVGVNFTELDTNEKESLLFKSLRIPTKTEVYLTKSTIALKDAGLRFRSNEEVKIRKSLVSMFWNAMSRCLTWSPVASDWIKSMSGTIKEITKFKEIGFDTPAILNEKCPNEIRIGSTRYSEKTALLLAKLAKIENYTEEIFHEKDFGFEEQLDQLISLLEESGISLRDDESKILEQEMQSLEENISKKLITTVTNHENISSVQLRKMLEFLKDLTKYDKEGNSLLYTAFWWKITLPEEIKIPGGDTSWKMCAEHNDYLANVKSSILPWEKEKINLLKKHGATFRDGEEFELKNNALKWILRYLSSDISVANRIENTENFVWEHDFSNSEKEFMSVTESFWLDDGTGLNRYYRNLFSSRLVNQVFPTLLNLCQEILPKEISYQNYKYGRVMHTRKYFKGFGGDLADLFSKNEKREKHSLLYIAWDKCYPEEVVNFLKNNGVNYINEEKTVITSLKKAQATVYLSRLISDKTKASVGALHSILGQKPDVNATFNGHSMLWHAKKNGLDESVIKILENAGAKLTEGE